MGRRGAAVGRSLRRSTLCLLSRCHVYVRYNANDSWSNERCYSCRDRATKLHLGFVFVKLHETRVGGA